MHWILAPDAFKGCLSAHQVAHAMASGILRADPTAQCTLQPMADGGEGTLAVLRHTLGGHWQRTWADDLSGRQRQVACLLLEDGTALIETARIVGLPLAGGTPLMQRTSRGVGQLMRACLDAGCRRLVLTLGGSGTNEGGAGCLSALGAVWLDAQEQALDGSPASLPLAARVDLTGLDPRLGQVPIEVWCDVDCPLLGEHGATRTFGRQKGAVASDLPQLEAALARVADLLAPDLAVVPGAGAAGGLGFALRFLGAASRPGAAAVADLCRFDQVLAGADWVLTGEGRSDAQTLAGKAPWEVARRARAAGVPVSLLSGGVEALPALSAAFDGTFSLCRGPVTLAYAKANAAALIADTAEQIARLARRSR
ncbi:MAG: glycerate kinase [Paludibacterium sp.]|uniref:glycerate kinase n=1 Tax=Paludibacterium sp. TaxID=1917523 RepID=UPI0025DFD6A9|nr:glycerate kinase [Paludibacterium sp.]MBV8049174.1 glycerate kinase [Paludibacterium sp.]MBV8646205.1 glycerate kinase [Paludibacterium sp.]